MCRHNNSPMTKYLVFNFIIFCSAICFGQLKTLEEFRNNFNIERNLIISNKLTSIELIQYGKKEKKWKPTGRRIYFFNSQGLITNSVITSIDRDGKDIEVWKGKYVYNSNGLCDSVPNDDGTMRKATNLIEIYTTLYVHLNNKKLKDGLIINIKPKKGKIHTLPTKISYHFKN